MPFQYERDDSRCRVVITFPGAFQPADALAAIERHHAEGAWTYGVLYDLRNFQGNPGTMDLKVHMERDRKPPAGESRARGPIAILTADPTVYSLACTYAALAQSTMRIAVFRDLTDADQWLIAQTSLLGRG